jgi:ribosomal protein S14
MMLPTNSSPTKLRNRCQLTYARAYPRKFGVRNALRLLAHCGRSARREQGFLVTTSEPSACTFCTPDSEHELHRSYRRHADRDPYGHWANKTTVVPHSIIKTGILQVLKSEG